MAIPKADIQFIENIEEDVENKPFNIYGSSYTIQPNIPDWINVDLAENDLFLTKQLLTYENDLFLTKQLLKRVYKEVLRISGEMITENFKQTLTQNWFWTSYEELIELLKRYKTIPDNTVTQASLLQNIQNMSKKMLRSNISPFRSEQ